MLPQVFQTLKASQAVKDIVGTNPPRIYRHGRAPQDTSQPYITWFLVAGTPENNLSDPSPVGRKSVQIDCWHQTDKGIEELADAVRDALEPVAHITQEGDDEQERDTKLFRFRFETDFWGR